jgi:5-formyltetrahydrofolate cyclo-ligase
MEAATAARALKKRVRQQLSARLRNLPAPYCQCCSAQLLPPLLALPAFQQSSAVFCFLSMPQEVQTLPLLEHCFRLGKRVFVPKVTSGKSRDMQVLEVQSLEHIQSFPKNSWGIPEPPSAEENGEWQARAFGAIDLVVVPGVGFDSQCHRMGHGECVCVCMCVYVCVCVCMGVWVYGCMGVCVYVCMYVWVYGCVAKGM